MGISACGEPARSGKIKEMSAVKKALKIIGIALLLLILAAGVYLYHSGPELPEGTDHIIEEVIASPLPELIKGTSGYASNNGVKIWYENIPPPTESKGVILLVMGISNDALGWPPKFIESFTSAGYQVIRFDHRGTGLSDWMEEYDANDPYTLSDMALDIVSVLDTLQVEKAHILGISMGGMIAQQMALDHPQRVHSLISVMSSGNVYDEQLPPISAEVAYDLIKVAIKYSIFRSEKNMIKLHLASRMILMGTSSHQANVEGLSQQVLYNLRKRRGYNSEVSPQHQGAVSIAGSRYDALKNLNVPTLIIHGKDDPFIPFAHGEKCARLIPNADWLWVDNMGHDIPDELIPVVAQKIIGDFLLPLQ